MVTSTGPRPLDGVRVVEFAGRIAGPLAAMILGDAGAEVVLVERPGTSRSSDAAAVLNRSKTAITLDLRSAPGRDDAKRLIKGADVVIENFRPGVMDRLDLGSDSCLGENPALVYCSISGFASDDPRRATLAWEQIVASATSIYRPARLHGPGGPEVGSGPALLAAPLVSAYAAIIAAHSIVAALIAGQRDGRGQHISTNLYDAAFEIVGHEFQNATLRGAGSGFKPPTRPGTAHYRCADGAWLHLCLFDDRHLRWFGETFAPDLASDGWFDGDALRANPERQTVLLQSMTELMITRPAAEWEVLINETSGAPAAICQSASAWLTSDQHARHSGAVIKLTDPLLGETSQLGYAIGLSQTALRAVARTFGEPPIWEARTAQTPDDAEPSDDPQPPLHGIRVVDFTQVLAGPTCGRVLAEYGASVVKVNRPADRGIPWHNWINRGKQSILLDIASPEARPVLDRLLEEADVVSQNFALGVADRLGIGETAARAARPDVIYSSITAFGTEGFRSTWRGREELGQAVTGLQVAWATSDGEPSMYTFPITDVGTGHLAALGILLSLFHRNRTGAGQSVSTSLAHTGTLLQAPMMIEHASRVWDEPTGQLTQGWSPGNRLFCGSDNRWFYVVADATRGLDVACFADLSAQDAVDVLNAAGHVAHVVVTSAELPEDPIAVARGISLVDNVGVVPRLSRSPLPALATAGRPGEDAAAVIAELGLDDLWSILVESGAIADVATAPQPRRPIHPRATNDRRPR